jgi:hypothetical protein
MRKMDYLYQYLTSGIICGQSGPIRNLFPGGRQHETVNTADVVFALYGRGSKRDETQTAGFLPGKTD